MMSSKFLTSNKSMSHSDWKSEKRRQTGILLFDCLENNNITTESHNKQEMTFTLFHLKKKHPFPPAITYTGIEGIKYLLYVKWHSGKYFAFLKVCETRLQSSYYYYHFRFQFTESIFPITISLRKQPTFREVATWALAKRHLSNERRNSILMTCTTQILVVPLIGWKKIPSRHNQSEALPRSG